MSKEEAYHYYNEYHTSSSTTTTTTNTTTTTHRLHYHNYCIALLLRSPAFCHDDHQNASRFVHLFFFLFPVWTPSPSLSFTSLSFSYTVVVKRLSAYPTNIIMCNPYVYLECHDESFYYFVCLHILLHFPSSVLSINIT